MERKNAGIGDVINAVELASEKELEELALIRESVDGLKGSLVASGADVPRSVAANIREANKPARQDSSAKADAGEIAQAMKKLNLGENTATTAKVKASKTKVDSSVDERQAGLPQASKRRREHTEQTLTPVQMAEAANNARKVFSKTAGGDGSKSSTPTRDARGRFIGGKGSKAASDAAEAKRVEKARHLNEQEEQEDRESFLKKLTNAVGELEDPSETRAVDAAGYAIGGPLWAIGKELGGITKEVGGTVNNARKSMAEVFKGNADKKERRGFFGRKSTNSADVVQLNTQKRTVQELEDQTDAIKEGDQKIIDRLDKIAGNTSKKGGGIFSKLFSMFGKGGKGLVTLLGGLLGGRLLGKVLGGKLGKSAIGKVGAMALGGFGLNKITRSLFGAGKGGGAALADGGGALAAKGVGRLGMKALGKGLLRAIPIVGALAGGIYDGVSGWNDTDGQRKAFGLADGQDPTTQQKTAYTLANILDMGGLVSGLSGAIGSALKSMGFDALGNMLQSFSTDSIAQAIDETLTSVGNNISNLGNTITSTFDNYTAKIGETVSGWFGSIKKELTDKLDSVVNFFTVENIKKVFEDAFNKILDFVKNPIDHITNKANEYIDSAKNGLSDVGNNISDGVKSAYKWVFGDDKTQGVIEKGVESAKNVAQSAGKEISKAVDSISESDVVKTASSGAKYLEESVGKTSVAVSNTARLATSNITGSDKSDVQKAAETYNNGNLNNVKINSIDETGSSNLKRMEPYFRQLEQQYGLPEGALYSVAATESGGHANAKSQTGARGMFQFTGIARKEVGMSDEDAWDPEKSAVGAAQLLSKYLKQANGDWNEAVTAYNAGFGTINKWKNGEKDLTKENKEYAIKVNTHRAKYLGGEAYTPGAGSNAGNVSSANHMGLPANAKIDEGTGLAFTPGENPFEKGGLVDTIGEKIGINSMADKFLSAPGMRHQVVQGTLAERAYGKGTNTPMGNIVSPNVTDQSPASDIQLPTARMPMDGRTISDLGGSGVKPTMQLADNTVSLDSDTKRLFARIAGILDRIEGHTKDTAKNQGATVKVNTPQPSVAKTVPLSIDDPLMNDYARID
ncbi:transglycosylase SLT domain-containing protein [Salmonella enterica subsp. enterica serovar Thompson]|nr:transglycosylase SLT domain-containing protein [Salmonella enterica subsp. enterica serovar Thompson]